MKYLYFIILLCFTLVGCGHNPTKVEQQISYIKPPIQFRQPCEYIHFDIEKNEYLGLSNSDKEQYLFGLVKDSITNTAACNKMIDSLNNWIEESAK